MSEPQMFGPERKRLYRDVPSDELERISNAPQWSAWTVDDIRAQEAAQRGCLDGVELDDDSVDAVEAPEDARHLLRAWNMVLRRRFAERMNAPEGCPDATAVCTLHLRRCALQAARQGLKNPTDALYHFVCPPWFEWWPVWLDALEEARATGTDTPGDVSDDLSWLDGSSVSEEKPRPGPRKVEPTLRGEEKRAADAAIEAWRAFPEREGDVRGELDETIRATTQVFEVPCTVRLARAVYAAVGVEWRAA